MNSFDVFVIKGFTVQKFLYCRKTYRNYLKLTLLNLEEQQYLQFWWSDRYSESCIAIFAWGGALEITLTVILRDIFKIQNTWPPICNYFDKDIKWLLYLNLQIGIKSLGL